MDCGTDSTWGTSPSAGPAGDVTDAVLLQQVKKML